MMKKELVFHIYARRKQSIILQRDDNKMLNIAILQPRINWSNLCGNTYTIYDP